MRFAPLLIAVALGLAPPSAARAGASGTRPNLLLLVAEDLGPRIGAFGDPVAVTPAIDRLAAGGVRYPNTFTTAGVCAPSRAALVLGVHQVATGAMHMRSGDRGYAAVPPPEVKAFPELLRAAGYWTFTGAKLDYQFSGVLAGSGPFTIWDDEGPGAHWRGRPDERPFFGLVNFQITHESALFPRPAWPRSTLHGAFQLLYLWEMWGHQPVVEPEDVTLPPYYPDTPTARRTLARHYDHVHRMDEQVGEILRELEADGLADSTLVIFTSDHGDGLPRAKRELYDSGIRVPLVVHWPRALRPAGVRAGEADPRLVSFLDLAPTLLSFAGVPVPAWMEGRPFVGPAAGPPRELVFAAKDRTDEIPDRARAVRDARFKYIRNHHAGEPGAARSDFRDHLDLTRELWDLHARGALEGPAALWFAPRPGEELYDTATDPHEVRNLAADPAHAATLARLRAALEARLAAGPDLGALPEDELRERFWPGGRQPVTQPPVPVFEAVGDGVRVSLTSPTPGASIGYRLDDDDDDDDDDDGWRLYTQPFAMAPGRSLEAKAVRYGYAASALVTAP